MEEEFQGGVCGGNLWNSSRNLFGLSPCSSSINDLGSFGWFNHGVIVDMKTAKSISEDNSAGSASDGGGGGSIVLQDVQKPQQPNSNGNMSVASTLQMMGISPSPSTTTDDWNQDLIQDSGRSQQNYSHMLQPTDSLDSSINNCREKIASEWTTNNFSANSSNIDSFKQVNQSFPLMQQHSNSFTNSPSYSYTSSLLQTLFDADSANYSSSPNYRMNSADSSVVKPNYLPKQQPANNNFQFVNNAPFWNATTAAATGDFRASFLPSTQPQLIPSSLSRAKLNPRNVTAKHHNGKAGDTVSVAKKVRNEPAFKHPRIETPSPLPTFKVRKEKLGDRVTALQQLVSPFGKTDTASVLHEAIEYIKLLHDQVTVLSTPYLKNGSPPLQRQQASDQEEPIKDLKSRGLCLVPISSTFPVAAETTADFWTPPFGGSFR